mgnify:CR=1 FL=1
MVKRTTLIIVALSVIAVLGWGFWIGLSITTGVEIGLLKGEIEALKSAYGSLNASYAELMDSYDELSAKYSELSGKYAKLNLTYTGLKIEYSMLEANYSMLKDDYEELLSIIEKGKAIAKSATWVSEDERLEVTTELIPRYTFGTLTGYDVNVTVTNVGDEPFNVVWIFLFIYVDDKLYEYWTPLGYSHSVESLYVGETYSYTFKYITKEMTSYKVLVIGG